MNKILVVEDEEKMRELIKLHLEKEGYQVQGVPDAYQALTHLQKNYYPVLIVDLKLPGMDGLRLLKEVKKIDPSIEVIMVTAYATVESAVEALKNGARDYLIKPFKMEELKILIERTMEEKRRKEENIYLKSRYKEEVKFSDLIYKSKIMERVMEKVKKIIPRQVTVLITGESGTGKELIARVIHYEGPRKDKPFVVVNCASLPETLLESELFGHEKGAFTGANCRRIGRFEFANGGTVFLDEIGELPLPLQAKLLRFLQYKEFERLGGNQTIRVDVRIIAATNKDLREEIREGKFREDLFYRLHVFPIHIPPLRERKEDIPLLAQHFLSHHYPRVEISSSALEVMLQYPWPGNVRELENALEHAALVCKGGKILPEDLPLNPLPLLPPFSPQEMSLENMERRLIEEALKITGGNQSRAARILGITRRTLIYRMKKYGIKK